MRRLLVAAWAAAALGACVIVDDTAKPSASATAGAVGTPPPMPATATPGPGADAPSVVPTPRPTTTATLAPDAPTGDEPIDDTEP